MQHPNFYGHLEPVREASEAVHAAGGLFVVAVDPLSLGLLAAPGAYGADIAVGEGQALGNTLSFGGPYLGFLAAKEELMRRIPGRIVGETVDSEGRRGYVLTLQAREQHIRRHRATSNICTNQALNALAASAYLALVGKEGLREAAYLSFQKAHYLAERLDGRRRREKAAWQPTVFQGVCDREPTAGQRAAIGASSKPGFVAGPAFTQVGLEPESALWSSARPRPGPGRRSIASSRRLRRVLVDGVTEGTKMIQPTPLLFESGAPGRRGFRFPAATSRRRPWSRPSRQSSAARAGALARAVGARGDPPLRPPLPQKLRGGPRDLSSRARAR